MLIGRLSDTDGLRKREMMSDWKRRVVTPREELPLLLLVLVDQRLTEVQHELGPVVVVVVDGCLTELADVRERGLVELVDGGLDCLLLGGVLIGKTEGLGESLSDDVGDVGHGYSLGDGDWCDS